MEMWKGLSYEAAMSIPMTRRRRFITKKIDLEKQRENQQKAALSSAKSRRRR
jgi:hypothetical protein